MTISSTVRKAGPFSGTGVQTAFPFAFKVFATSDMLVVQMDPTGIEHPLLLGSGYSVALNADQDAAPGGTVTLPAALPAGYLLTISSAVPLLQGASIPNMGGFYPKVIEQALDKLTVTVQQVADAVSRSIRFSLSDSASNSTLPQSTVRAGKFLAFDAVGNPTASSGTGADAGLRTDLASSLSGSSLVSFIQAGVGALLRTVKDKLRESVSLADFGGDLTGATDSTAAAAAAIAYLRSVGGGTLKLGRGAILLAGAAGQDGVLNGLLVPFTNPNSATAARIVIQGEGRNATRLLCGSNNMTLVRYSDSHCQLKGMTLDGNGKAGCTGLGVAPETLNNVAETYQLYNRFRDLYITGLDEGIVLKVGKTIAGSDSGCWYNHFADTDIYSCKRGIYHPAPAAGYGGGTGRNTFSDVRVGQNCNTGLQNDGGGTNTYRNVHFEGILQVAGGPNATPTAIVDSVGTNFYIGCVIEACTRHIQNSGIYNTWIGGAFTAANCVFTVPFRTAILDSLFTMGGVAGGVVNIAAPQPFEIVTPNGADFRIPNVSGANTYLAGIGGSGNTVSIDSANTNGAIVHLVNGVEMGRVNANKSIQYGGAANGGFHSLNRAGATEGTKVLEVFGDIAGWPATFFDHRQGGYSQTGAALWIGKNSTTSRSINAGGTVNASGADYAEYMRKAVGCATVAKGQIVGITAGGEITDRFADAVAFAVKSTDPSYVGADTWGRALGDGPTTPIFTAPEYTGPKHPGINPDGADPATHELAARLYSEAWAAHEQAVAQAQQQFDTVTWPTYEAAKAAFDAQIEEVRQTVDRIAFAGQVPVNVLGATSGQFIVPAPDGDGIGGITKNEADMTLADYMRAVGKVIAIEADGRARIIVKVA